MGSEGPAPSPVTVHVTGFKKFHGVAENPTETIVRNLKDYLEKKGVPKGLALGSCNVLETAGQGAVVPLYQTLQSAINASDSELPNSGKIIWVSSQLLHSFFGSYSMFNHLYPCCSFLPLFIEIVNFFRLVMNS